MNRIVASLMVAESTRIADLLRDWREDTMTFLRHDLPKLLVVVIGAVILIRLLRAITRKIASLHAHRLPSGIRAEQVRTLAAVITSVGVFVIVFVAVLEVLSILGLNLGPLLASAGIAGLAIGFGAQTLVHDVINGFFILLENQYDIGDVVRIAGVRGTVESMTLRRTVLRDADGALHSVPNSQINVVSNLTRDWAQVTLHVAVAYNEPSEKVISLLTEVGREARNDAALGEAIVADPEVPGIERVSGGEVDYLMLVKTRP